eukprot:gene12745-26843_t
MGTSEESSECPVKKTSVSDKSSSCPVRQNEPSSNNSIFKWIPFWSTSDKPAASSPNESGGKYNPKTNDYIFDDKKDTSQLRNLHTVRAVSSIPKGEFMPSHQPGNVEKWVYPSEQQYFNAMKKKGYNPREEDVPVVLAIHNMVNEEAYGSNENPSERIALQRRLRELRSMLLHLSSASTDLATAMSNVTISAPTGRPSAASATHATTTTSTPVNHTPIMTSVGLQMRSTGAATTSSSMSASGSGSASMGTAAGMSNSNSNSNIPPSVSTGNTTINTSATASTSTSTSPPPKIPEATPVAATATHHIHIQLPPHINLSQQQSQQQQSQQQSTTANPNSASHTNSSTESHPPQLNDMQTHFANMGQMMRDQGIPPEQVDHILAMQGVLGMGGGAGVGGGGIFQPPNSNMNTAPRTVPQPTPPPPGSTSSGQGPEQSAAGTTGIAGPYPMAFGPFGGAPGFFMNMTSGGGGGMSIPFPIPMSMMSGQQRWSPPQATTQGTTAGQTAQSQSATATPTTTNTTAASQQPGEDSTGGVGMSPPSPGAGDIDVD